MSKKTYKPPDNVGNMVPGGAENLPEVEVVTNPVGRPTLYRPEYCQQIIQHMKQGFSASSFGAQINVSAESISAWKEAHPEFAEAINIGQVLLEHFYQKMGQMIATGQFRRVIKETPRLDKQGRPQYDAQGNLIADREYAPAHTNAAAWIFLTKNLLKWRDRWDVGLVAPGAPEKPIEEQPREVLQGRFLRLVEKAKVVK